MKFTKAILKLSGMIILASILCAVFGKGAVHLAAWSCGLAAVDQWAVQIAYWLAVIAGALCFARK